MLEKKVIFTSLPNLVNLGKQYTIRSCSFLPNSDWIRGRIKQMSGKESSSAEIQFMKICKSFSYNLFRQVYFKIGEHQYFLDFFIPSKNIAIEIDGPTHKQAERAEYDQVRDSVFKSVGIRTIRFSVEEMRKPDFVEKSYIPKLSNLGFRIRPKAKKSKHQKQLIEAIGALNRVDKNSILEIQSNSTALLRAISRDKPSPIAKDLPLLDKFYHTARVKRIKLVFRFIGKMDNMTKRERSWIRQLAKKSDSVKADSVVAIT